MDWRTTYPPLAAVMAASFETLATWKEHLPRPQTDVEHTVARRLDVRLHVLAGERLREVAPDVAEKFNRLVDELDRLGIKTAVKKF